MNNYYYEKLKQRIKRTVKVYNLGSSRGFGFEDAEGNVIKAHLDVSNGAYFEFNDAQVPLEYFELDSLVELAVLTYDQIVDIEYAAKAERDARILKDL